MSPALGLAHEMGHFGMYLDGEYREFENLIWEGRHNEANNLLRKDGPIEKRVVEKWETPIARELGEPVRAHYSDIIGVIRTLNSTHFAIRNKHYNAPK